MLFWCKLIVRSTLLLYNGQVWSSPLFGWLVCKVWSFQQVVFGHVKQLGAGFKFWYNKLVHKNLGGPSLGLYVCIYTSLHNVNIVWLPDAISIGTKNLKGVDSLGFPGSARRHATCTMSSINRAFVYEFHRVNKQTLTWQQFGWTIRGDEKKKAGLYDAIIS